MEEATDGFVLDCSVTMAWCFDDEATPYTVGVLDRLTEVRAIVPMLWPLEVANVVIVGERRKRLDEARTLRFLALLVRLADRRRRRDRGEGVVGDHSPGPFPQSFGV